MKNNQPVTGKEKKFSRRDNLLSTTDLKGAVDYVNDDFCRIAEFDRDALVGHNHNVVRHPDMPPAAFENLWQTLKAGNSWKGIVKNRCSSGDHYWVDAYVTPITDKSGHPYEYQSVRFIPEADEVKRAEEVYQDLNKKLTPKALRGLNPSLALRMSALSCIGLLPLLALALWKAPEQFSWIALGTLLSVGLTATMVRIGLTPLEALSAKARALFDNELMRYIYTGRRDDIGQIELGMKMMDSQRRAILGRVQNTSQQMREAASETHDLMRDTNQGAETQQSEIHQLVAAVEEMSASIQEVAHNCEASSGHAAEALRLTAGSREISQETISTNDALVAEVEAATHTISELAKRSQEIGSVLDVIKSIAEQTNLLALNAAIEAARAGEQGRGFAVVADEVRTLAQRTQASTEEIEQMIVKLQQGTQNAVEAMERSKTSSGHSVEQLSRFSEALANIDQAVEGIANMSLQIATASEEQSCVASEVSENITSISTQSDETVLKAKRAHELAAELGKQAERQLALVDHFTQ